MYTSWHLFKRDFSTLLLSIRKYIQVQLAAFITITALFCFLFRDTTDLVLVSLLVVNLVIFFTNTVTSLSAYFDTADRSHMLPNSYTWPIEVQISSRIVVVFIVCYCPFLSLVLLMSTLLNISITLSSVVLYLILGIILASITTLVQYILYIKKKPSELYSLVILPLILPYILYLVKAIDSNIRIGYYNLTLIILCSAVIAIIVRYLTKLLIKGK